MSRCYRCRCSCCLAPSCCPLVSTTTTHSFSFLYGRTKCPWAAMVLVVGVTRATFTTRKLFSASRKVTLPFPRPRSVAEVHSLFSFHLYLAGLEVVRIFSSAKPPEGHESLAFQPCSGAGRACRCRATRPGGLFPPHASAPQRQPSRQPGITRHLSDTFPNQRLQSVHSLDHDNIFSRHIRD